MKLWFLFIFALFVFYCKDGSIMCIVKLSELCKLANRQADFGTRTAVLSQCFAVNSSTQRVPVPFSSSKSQLWVFLLTKARGGEVPLSVLSKGIVPG